MRTGTASVPEGSLKAGRISDSEAVGQALKQVLARNEMTGTRAFVAVTDATATFRVLELAGSATDQQVSAAVARELALDPERFSSRWIDVGSTGERRIVYAAAWDRGAMEGVTDAIRAAGLEASVVELKSASITRAVVEPDCVVLDLVADPAEIVLVDGGLPRQWHAVDLAGTTAEDRPGALAAPIQSVIRFHKRSPRSRFNSHCPVLIAAEEVLAAPVMMNLADLVGHPVRIVSPPPRVPADLRHHTYLTCLGLMMRRST